MGGESLIVGLRSGYTGQSGGIRCEILIMIHILVMLLFALGSSRVNAFGAEAVYVFFFWIPQILVLWHRRFRESLIYSPHSYVPISIMHIQSIVHSASCEATLVQLCTRNFLGKAKGKSNFGSEQCSHGPPPGRRSEAPSALHLKNSSKVGLGPLKMEGRM